MCPDAWVTTTARSRRHLVQIAAHHPAPAEINRVEPPGRHRRIRLGHRALRLLQPRNHLANALQPRMHPPIRPPAVEKPEIRVKPGHALEQMAMPLHKARHQHLARKPVIDLGRPKRRHILGAAKAKNTPVADCHMRRLRHRRIHRKDPLGNQHAGLRSHQAISITIQAQFRPGRTRHASPPWSQRRPAPPTPPAETGRHPHAGTIARQATTRPAPTATQAAPAAIPARS